MAARKKIVPVDQLSDEELVLVAQKVEATGAILVKGAFSVPLTKKGETLVREALARRGIEWAGRFLRLPADVQLTRRLSSGASFEMTKLPKLILGGFRKPEVDHAVRDGVQAGRIVVVREGKKTRVENASSTVLTGTELKALREQAIKLTSLLKSVQPKRGALPATLDRSLFFELARLFDDIARAGQNETSLPSTEATKAALSLPDRIAHELVLRRNDQTGEVQIPDLVTVLNGEGVSSAEIHRILLEFSSDGRVELRPDSGYNLLSDTQRALCIRGPHGSTLSAARWLGPNPEKLMTSP